MEANSDVGIMLATAVAAAPLIKPGRWVVDFRATHYGYKEQGKTGDVFLFDKDTDRRIHLKTGYHSCSDRIEVTPCGLKINRSHSIFVGLKLGPVHLARHINKRFMGYYLELKQESDDWQTNYTASQQDAALKTEALKRVIDLTEHPHAQGWSCPHGSVRESYNGGFSFDLILDADAAIRVGALLQQISNEYNQ